MKKSLYKIVSIALMVSALNFGFILQGATTLRKRNVDLEIQKDLKRLEREVAQYKSAYKAARENAPEPVDPGSAVVPSCDLTPVLNLLGQIIAKLGYVTDKTSITKTVLGILGDPNAELWHDANVSKALKKILDELDQAASCCESVLDQVITIDSKVDVIDSEVDVIDSEVDVIDSKVDVIDSKIDNILEDSCCDSVIERVIDIDSKVDVIDSKIDQMDTTCCDSILENVVNIDSKVDIIDSKIDQMDTTCCDSILENVVNIDSKVDIIDSKIDQMDTACCDSILDNVANVDSKVDVLINDTCCDTVSSKIDVIDGKVDNVQGTADTIDSKVDVINSKIDQMDTACCDSILDNVVNVDSKVDVLINDTCCDTVSSKIDVIDGKVDNVQGTADTIDSKVDVLINDTCCDTVSSKVDVIDGKVDNVQGTADTIDSKVDILINDTCCDTVSSKIDVIDGKVDNVQGTADTIDSKVDVINSKIDQMDTACCDSILDNVVNVDSKVDVLINDTCCDTVSSKIDVIDSKVDNVQGTADTIDSKVDILINDTCCDTVSSKVDVIDGKVDNVQGTADTIDSKVDILINDTCCDTVSSKIDVMDSKVDKIEVAVLDETSMDLIGGRVKYIFDNMCEESNCESILDKLDQSGSCCESVLDQVSSSDTTKLGGRASKLYQKEGTPIGTSDIPYTISSPGRYYLVESLVSDYASTTVITINSDNVFLDLNGMTISNNGNKDNSIAISVTSTNKNIFIGGGAIIGFQYGISLAEDNNNIELLRLNIKECRTGVDLVGTSLLPITNILIRDCFFDKGLSISSDAKGLSAANCHKIFIANCFANGNSTTQSGSNAIGFYFENCEQGRIERCVANTNIGVSGIDAGFYLDQCDFFTLIGCEAVQNGEVDSSKGYGFLAYLGHKNIFKECIAAGNKGMDYDDDSQGGGRGFHLELEAYDSILESFSKNNGQIGIALIETDSSWITNNEVDSNGQFGIALVNDGSSLTPNSNQVLSNKMLDNGDNASGTRGANLYLSAETINNVIANNHAFISDTSIDNYKDNGDNLFLAPLTWNKFSGPGPSYYADNFDISP